jgi:hypothetical protein
MGRNAVSHPNTKNETSGSVYHALQLRKQSAKKTIKERTGIVNVREDKRLNKALPIRHKLKKEDRKILRMWEDIER